MTAEPIALRRKLPFDILDSIRGIAALYVAIAHCRGTLWVGGSEFLRMYPRSGWSVWDYCMFGGSMLTRLAVEFVIVFFVLSGFSIAHSLSGNKSPLQFYKRRFIRIYPSYVIAIIWAALVYVITLQWHPGWYDHTVIDSAIKSGATADKVAFIRSEEMNTFFNWNVLFKNLLYMPGGGYVTPFWSLTYEVIFYLLAPFLIRKVNVYALVSLVLFLANLVIPGKIQSIGIPVYIYSFLFQYNIYFVVGIVLYKNYEQIAGAFQSLSRKTMVGFILLLTAMMYGVNFYMKGETVYSYMVSALLGVMFILFFLKYELRIKWLMNIGKFSYTLYITHFASVFLYLGIYWLIFKPQTYYILNFFVWMPAVLFVVLIAWLQYFLVERKTKNILNALRTNKQGKKAPEEGNTGFSGESVGVLR